MITPYVSAEMASAFRNSGNRALFFRLGTDPALHLTVGFNDLPIGMETIDPEGTVYRGAGLLQTIPEFEVLINGIADEVAFGFSGVSQEFLSKLYADAPPVLGAVAKIGVAPLDDRYQPMSAILPLWTGTADFWGFQQEVEPDDEKALKRTIKLVTIGGESSRSGQTLATYENVQQQLLHPGDRFCDRVSRYVQTFVVSWPRF